jgi:hypothetical protein
VSEAKLTASEALTELQELMRLAASGEPLLRQAATTYTTNRDVLLQSELRPMLPGFLLQCLTVYRFKDFIQLYSPSVEDRIAFVDAAIGACETRANMRPAFDVFAENDF